MRVSLSTDSGEFRSTLLIYGPECSPDMLEALSGLVLVGSNKRTLAEDKSVVVAATGSVTRISAPSTWLVHLQIEEENPTPRVTEIFNLISGD